MINWLRILLERRVRINDWRTMPSFEALWKRVSKVEERVRTPGKQLELFKGKVFEIPNEAIISIPNINQEELSYFTHLLKEFFPNKKIVCINNEIKISSLNKKKKKVKK